MKEPSKELDRLANAVIGSARENWQRSQGAFVTAKTPSSPSFRMKEASKELDRLANAVIGAAIEVHRHLGPGFLQSVYEESLCKELELMEIPFSRQQVFRIEYKYNKVGEGRIDLLVGDELIVEIKAVSELIPIHSAQILSYLKANNKHLGLLINFNVPLLKDGVKRVILS